MLMHHGSLCVIQFFTRSPRWRDTTSAYSTKASAVARAGQPPAILQHLRQIPVVERGERGDACVQQPIDQAAVEIQPGLDHRPRPLGRMRGQAIEKR